MSAPAPSPHYTPEFVAAVEIVLTHEGGYVDDARDPGGATHWGISLRWLAGQGVAVGDLDGDGDVDAADIRALTRGDAIALYHRYWWLAYGYDRLPSPIGGKVFDLAVNMGAPAAHRCLQRGLRAAGWAVEDDGVLGPLTVAAAQRCADAGALPALLAGVREAAAGRYRAIIAAAPAMAVYERGWLRRAYT